MKWSPLLHGIAAITGILGALSLISSWLVRTGTILGLSQNHLFNNAIGLLLASIAFGIGTLIHMQQGR